MNILLIFIGDIDMIEADIVLGTLENDPSQKIQPIMSHDVPLSDISLAQFLDKIINFNKAKKDTEQKGIKLDFKSTIVFTESLPIIDAIWKDVNFPFWINADILPGPVENTQTTPVDATIFLQNCKKYTNAVISSGWTTRWGSNFTQGHYTIKQIHEMVEAIETNKLNETGHLITFPVRAGITANSGPELKSLYHAINKTNSVTFTIWSSKNDYVDSGKLENFICSFGTDKIYLDVPEELERQLHLSCSNSSDSYFAGGYLNLFLMTINLILYIFSNY